MQLIQKSFPCKKCGASQVFYTKNGVLRCEYCKSETKITPLDKKIVEYDLTSAIQSLKKSIQISQNRFKCPSCSASFDLKPYIRSSKCPFCKTPIVSNLDIFMPIASESILPFKLSKDEAIKIFKKWISSLWFVPKNFDRVKNSSFNIVGIYIPYWSFDTLVTATYRGLRGKIYHQNIHTEVFENGKMVNKRVTLTKTKWTPVNGKIKKRFDDFLVGASYTISKKLINSLSPWDLKNLKPYDERYLSGFESEVYQIGLDDGLKSAKERIKYIIIDQIRAQIGGDKQKITYLDIRHSNITYKNVLLPIWSGEFVYNKRKYNFIINGRNGKIKGDRPYSKIKIFILLFLVFAIFIAVFYISSSS